MMINNQYIRLSKRILQLTFLSFIGGSLTINARYPDASVDQDDIVLKDSLSTESAIADSIPSEESVIRKVLFVGDSMTGWMAERLNAYGDINGFDVAAIVWDGSTIRKWGNSHRLKEIILEHQPDAVIVSLGMNELFERNPQEELSEAIGNIKIAFADTPYLWIGPPSWPGHKEGAILNDWLLQELGNKNFFRSSSLEIPRQSKSNPHPSRKGIEIWIDSIAEWIPDNSNLKFPSLSPPEEGKFSRGSIFIYKRMKENL